ncbi:MAG TPA: cyclase family protein [Candidatus Acidoferrales bacterium]|nr:cyclase family protein [Candidatus Acidoferrales bacterium]
MNRKHIVRIILAGLAAVVAVGVVGEMIEKRLNTEQSAAAAPGAPARILDLGHALGPDNPAWPGDDKPFEAIPNASMEKDGYFTRKFTSLEHFGTHLDAPAHFAKGGWTVDQIPVERLYGPAVVLEAREESRGNADYRLTPEKIADWEKRHGRIPRGAIVLMRTGWTERWPDAARYRNMDAANVMHFPGYSVEAVKVLIDRGAVGLGIDTLSVDYGASKQFEVHQLSHGASLYHMENLADLSAMPETGARLVVAPIKLEGGSGGPARVFALLQ